MKGFCGFSEVQYVLTKGFDQKVYQLIKKMSVNKFNRNATTII